MQKIELNHEELDFRSREAFRTLRTNIEFSGDDVKVICLTSCTPNEGKSDPSLERGKAFAQTGNKVLLICGPVPPNPSELLGNDRFKNMIARAREEYDMVIIDTPPLGSVIDTAVVSKVCDGVVLVVAAGTISYRFVRSVKEQLEVTGCRILGAVLNKVDMTGKGYYGKYYGRYYGRYYGKYYGKYYGNYGEE